MCAARRNWRWLFRQLARWARCLAPARAGKSSAAKIAMMAITTSSSIKVKAGRFCGSEDFKVGVLRMGYRLRLLGGTVELARLAGVDRIGQSRQTVRSEHQLVGKLGPGRGGGPGSIGGPHFYFGQAIGINRGSVRGTHDQLQLRAVQELGGKQLERRRRRRRDIHANASPRAPCVDASIAVGRAVPAFAMVRLAELEGLEAR